ncbi:ABC transporter substrate-binding protein [Pseudonocardia saturnea]
MNTRPPRRRPTTWALFVSLLALLVSTTACGDGDAGGRSATTIVVGSPCKTCLKTLLTASREIEGTPYALEFADFDSAPPLIEAMKAGRVDVAWGGEVPVFFGISNGAPVVLLAGGRSSASGQSRILVKEDSPIRTVADLRGKKIAMPLYTVPHYPLAVALQEADLAWSDVEVVNLNTTDGLAAFNAGSVDAFVVWDPNAAVVETEHGGRTLQPLGDVINPDSAYYAAAGAVQDPAKRAAIEDLTGRVVRAFAWVGEHKAEWAGQVTELTGVPAAAAGLAADRQDWQLVPVDDGVRATWQQEVDFFAQLGQITAPFPVAEHVVPGFDTVVAGALATLDRG